MKEKECKLVQDLLPNYIEKLTSKESNKIIETHLKECPECKRILEDMQYDIGLKSKEQCQKETKYMKKYRNKLKILKFLGLILLIIVLAFVVTTIRKYIILNDLYNKSQTINIETKDFLIFLMKQFNTSCDLSVIGNILFPLSSFTSNPCCFRN